MNKTEAGLRMGWLMAAAIIIWACGDGNKSRSGKKPQAQATKADHTADWNRLGWIDKAARTLRNGKGLSYDDDTDRLLGMSKGDVIKEFMQSNDFIDTTYHFNKYFLGFYKAPDDFNPASGIDSGASRFPSAIASAKAVKSNGNYFALLNFKQAIVLDQEFADEDEILQMENGIEEGILPW